VISDRLSFPASSVAPSAFKRSRNANIRSGSKTDIEAPSPDVRFAEVRNAF
jgi:hypothetical protein